MARALQTLHTTQMMGRVIRLGLVLLLLTAVPRAAAAVTVDQIVALTKAGVAEPIILALIERDRTVFTIDPEQLVTLQREGVSQTVILAMLKSGREGGLPARTDTGPNAAAATAPPVVPEIVPDVVLLGHGPEWPNVAHSPYSSAPPVDLLPVPYAFPFGVPFWNAPTLRHRRHPGVSTLTPTQAAPSICIQHPSSVGTPPAVGSMGFVTACPPGVR